MTDDQPDDEAAPRGPARLPTETICDDLPKKLRVVAVLGDHPVPTVVARQALAGKLDE